MLLSDDVDYEIIDTMCDLSDNILGLHIRITSHSLILFSVYGPPNQDNISFFQDLSRFISLYADYPIIAGGDWNLTYSTADTIDNIDIHQMVSPPSLIKSRLLADICERFNLSDPYRALHPDRRDFTFRPTNRRNNRSRLDFFLISDNLRNCVSTCDVRPEIVCSLFDHHYVSLFLTQKKLNLYKK